MWEYIEKVKTILIIIASGLTIKNQVDSVFIKQQLKEAHQFLMMKWQQPFYNRIGIGLSYLFLIVCFMYAALAFAIKIEEGHDSVTKLLLGIAFFAFASINYFRASINLYK